ncbi:RNA polymerase sigma factor [Pseudonocardia sp. TRM90224]|uniref:RNA polymerase sigma factor n=1 Tax=Pseudonocardia sp. TRM90224 TaxID=2812678 RepID=UPI001E40A12F|nr:DUF6596 domain-containing protein [Pseudonocardia sp. TRM90224]
MPDRSAADRPFEYLLRELAPQVLGALVRRYGHFDACEDAVQEALLAAALKWPDAGVPDDPRSWLIRIGSYKLIDQLRSDRSRREREAADAVAIPRTGDAGGAPVAGDDSLVLLFLSCHPALTQASQVALTLRAVGGLTTGEIAAAFLVPEPTMGQRITRAKAKLRGATFRMPPADELDERLASVLQVLYLIFNEGYSSTGRDELVRVELTAEAIRLARMAHRQLPEHGEVAGLLALMLLTDARRAARTGPAGELIPMAEQDRTRWDAAAIAEGTELVTDAMRRTALGPYQLQAAIAALHAEAADADATDWMQILGLYTLLERMTDNPVVTLNRAVAAAMVHGPDAGLRLLDRLAADPRFGGHHRADAVRAHLLEMKGDLVGAAAGFRTAARRATSHPEQRYLLKKAAELA